MEKIRVGLLFGGVSAEHEVSLHSAQNVIAAIDREKYEIVLIGIDKKGEWYLFEEDNFLINADDPTRIRLNIDFGLPLGLVPSMEKALFIVRDSTNKTFSLDVIFPIVHGTFGEDGTLQGLLKLLDIPFVGASVLGSAVSMDKDVMKRLIREAGLPTPHFVTIYKHNQEEWSYEDHVKMFGPVFFVKPASCGSSVGISKVKTKEEYKKAIELAFKFDHKLLVEQAIVGREIEVAVLGNINQDASMPGEVIPHDEFYSYKAKYIDKKGADLIVPADLTPTQMQKLEHFALSVCHLLCCDGMARVDFFVTDTKVYINEINTIPGFTSISMYPRMWQASGLTYPDLIDRLLQLAIDRHRYDRDLKLSYT